MMVLGSRETKLTSRVLYLDTVILRYLWFYIIIVLTDSLTPILHEISKIHLILDAKVFILGYRKTFDLANQFGGPTVRV